MKYASLRLLGCLAVVCSFAACDTSTQALASETAVATSTSGAPESIPLANALGNSGNQKIIQAMNVCLDNFPNMLAVRNELRTSNFKSEGRFGGIEYFSAFNRDIIAFGSVGTSKPLCGFGRDGLRDEEAVLVAASILGAKFGSSLAEFDTSADPQFIAAYYIEKEDGTKVVVAVRRQITLSGLYRGSPIYVSEFIEPEEE